MIFEWYSGSDTTGYIPRRVTELLSRAHDGEKPELAVDELLKLVEEEKDPNMKGKICYAAATVAANAGNDRRYEELCRRALEYFDPLAANFPDVVEEYVWSNFGAIDKTGDASDEKIERNIPLKLAGLVWADKAGVGEDHYVAFLEGLGSFFALCGERYGLPVFWRLSLICALRAHHRSSEDVYCLGLIARAKQELGDKEGLERVRRMVEELGYDIYNLPEP